MNQNDDEMKEALLILKKDCICVEIVVRVYLRKTQLDVRKLGLQKSFKRRSKRNGSSFWPKEQKDQKYIFPSYDSEFQNSVFACQKNLRQRKNHFKVTKNFPTIL